MPSPFCKTLRRIVGAPSSVTPFLFAKQVKVQRAVLLPPFVEARLRNVSMLKFARPIRGPLPEPAAASSPTPFCFNVENRNLQHAEDRTCKTWRLRLNGFVLRAWNACLYTPFRDVSRLTSGLNPSRPRVQRLNIPRERSELVQDRCAGDTV